MQYDRDELLARTELAELADELLGWHVGNGRSARWPSPVPGHPQTGKTPPMSVFVDHRGVERWTCFATGANGTAIDLVTTATGRTVGDAMTWLAERARMDRPPLERGPTPRRPPSPPPPSEPSDALREYVEACERNLWQPAGAAIRRWLVDERCLDPDVLRLNRVGADPGRRTLRRAKGLPLRGPAAVFPALDDARQPVYLQARYLHPPPGRGKYDNPSKAHGRNPRATTIEPVSACPDGPWIVTEGVPDALAVASIGHRAVAVFGAGVTDEAVAGRLSERGSLVLIAFDSDCAGRNGSLKLAERLRSRGTRVTEIEPPCGDLNAWLVAQGGTRMRRELDRQVRLASVTHRDRGIGRSIA